MENEGTRRLKTSFSILLLILAAALAAPLARAAGPKVVLDIPAGSALETLPKFYLQSKVEVLYLTQSLKDVKTNAVSGELTASTALEQMFAGTGVTFEFENELSATIWGPNEARAGQARSAEPSSPASAAPQGQQQGIGGQTSGGPISLGELTVTGSYIRGVLDLISPLEIVTKRETKRTAYATVQDALQTLPLNSGVVQGEDFTGTGNYGHGTAVNLRGLGAGATLVLVNGRRQPNAGLNADFVDVSNIPWSAVERIDVLPDGSSALYGSDAIAGVTNIIMREDLDGAETQARFGTAPDGAAETMVAQLFGKHWRTGKGLFAYQYSQRTSLSASDRAYAADTDKTSLGGANHRIFRSNPGNVLDPRSFQPAFAIPYLQDGTALTPQDLLPGVTNYQNTFKVFDLMPDKEMHNVYVTGTQKIGEHFELFGEGRYSQREVNWLGLASDQLLMVPASNPYFVDPFGGSPYVLVAYNFLDDLGPLVGTAKTENTTGTFGVRRELSREWLATLSASYGEEKLRYEALNQINVGALNAALADSNPATAFNPFGDGSHTNPLTLAAIRSTQRNSAISEIATINFMMDGPLFRMPSGTTRLAVGAEERTERLFRDLRGPQYYERNVKAAFAELSAPLMGTAADVSVPPRLELSVAARYEEYDDFGSTFNPKVGLRWAPLKSLKLRTSWGSSFKAPKLIDLYDTSQNLSGFALFPDPKSPTNQSMVLVRQGSNPDLDEETATTWTAGLDLTPGIAPGMAVSLTWYAINYKDRIIQPGANSLFQILLNENQWGSVITRNPSRAEVDAICDSPEFFASRAQCKVTNPAALIDIRLRNLAITRVKGLDLALDHSLRTGIGQLGIKLNGNYVFDFQQAVTNTSPTIDIVDTAQNPLRLRLRGAVEWNQRGPYMPGLGINLSVDYTGSYKNPGALRQNVDAWTGVNLYVAYRTAARIGWLSNTELALNATNLFDKAPPFVDQEWGYDYVNMDPVGRVVSFFIQKNW